MMRLALLLAFFAFAGGAYAAPCAARSGRTTAALVELYTAQDCIRCAPAERWLAGVGTRYTLARLVPLELYVDSWSYGGKQHAPLQRRLTPLQRRALVYTPQVMLQGQDFRGWPEGAFEEALAGINDAPAKASIGLRVIALNNERIDVEAAAELLDAEQKVDPVLYLAAYETKPGIGVNWVLEWQGPFTFAHEAQIRLRRELTLVPHAIPANSGVVAFVQNRRTAAVLQALMLPACEEAFGYSSRRQRLPEGGGPARSVHAGDADPTKGRRLLLR
jgi:hypothetical protein